MKYNRWTDDEKEIIRQHFARTEWKALFKMLPGRSYAAILGKANKLGLKRVERNCKRGAAWKTSDDELLQKVAARKISIEDAVKKLNRTPSAIYLRMTELRISASRFSKRSSDIAWKVIDPGRSVNGNQRQRSRTRLSPLHCPSLLS